MKARYRYNWSTKQWDELFRFERSMPPMFDYINATGSWTHILNKPNPLLIK